MILSFRITYLRTAMKARQTVLKKKVMRARKLVWTNAIRSLKETGESKHHERLILFLLQVKHIFGFFKGIPTGSYWQDATKKKKRIGWNNLEIQRKVITTEWVQRRTTWGSRTWMNKSTLNKKKVFSLLRTKDSERVGREGWEAPEKIFIFLNKIDSEIICWDMWV